MPSPPTVPDVMRFRISGVLTNDAAWGVRIYTGYTGGVPTVANMLTLCEGVGTAWNDTVVSFQNIGVTTTEIDGIDLSATDGAGNTADVSYSGVADTSPTPNQVAAVAKFDIARRYRGGKPKMYIPGIDSQYVSDESHWKTSFADDMGSGMNAFNTAIKATYADAVTLTGIVNVSFYEGFTSVENPITHRWRNVPTYRDVALVDVVGGFTVDQVFGTQKRRRLA